MKHIKGCAKHVIISAPDKDAAGRPTNTLGVVIVTNTIGALPNTLVALPNTLVALHNALGAAPNALGAVTIALVACIRSLAL